MNENAVYHVYEIARTISWLKENHYKKVALQFPDEMAKDAYTVSRLLEDQVDGLIPIVLADVVYSSCCIDEITAKHISPDCIIHYGHSCLSPPLELPVFYVFTCQPIDHSALLSDFHKTFPDPSTSRVIVVFDTIYSHVIDLFKESVIDYPHVIVCKNPFPGTERVEGLIAGREIELPTEENLTDYSLFYIGAESLSLSNLAIHLHDCQAIYNWNPKESDQGVKLHNTSISRLLKRRFYLMSRVEEATKVGILVGTLSVSRYRDMVEHLEDISSQAGKQTYIIYVGRPNPAKLANFSSLHLFVLVACPESTLLDSKEYLQPIVSPYEYEVALSKNRIWLQNGYVVDFAQILKDGKNYVEFSSKKDPEDSNDTEGLSGALQAYGTRDLISQGHGENGSWWGLDPRLGKDPAALVQEGRSGLAWEYKGEPH